MEIFVPIKRCLFDNGRDILIGAEHGYFKKTCDKQMLRDVIQSSIVGEYKKSYNGNIMRLTWRKDGRVCHQHFLIIEITVEMLDCLDEPEGFIEDSADLFENAHVYTAD